jgi:hypothetical protein
MSQNNYSSFWITKSCVLLTIFLRGLEHRNVFKSFKREDVFFYLDYKGKCFSSIIWPNFYLIIKVYNTINLIFLDIHTINLILQWTLRGKQSHSLSLKDSEW